MSLKSILLTLAICVYTIAVQAQSSVPVSTVKQANTTSYENVAVGDFSKDGDRADGMFNKDNRIAVDLTEGEHDSNNDFIQVKVCKISGSVMEDTDNDNEGDKAIPGVVIRLFDKEGNPAVDVNGKAVPFEITNVYGFYQFQNLRAGEYVIIKADVAVEETNNTQVKEVDHSIVSKPKVNAKPAIKEATNTKNEAPVVVSNQPTPKADASFQDIVDNKVPSTTSEVVMNPSPTETKSAVKPEKEPEVFEMPVQKHVLLVGSSIDEASQAFLPFKMNFGNYLYENYDYVSHPKLGTGYDVNLNLPDLLNYEMIFLKMDMGSFSEDMINALAEYIEIGGKIYIIFDAHDRAYYLDKMEANVNLLLKKVQISDQVKFSHEIVNNQNKSGVVHTISNTVRKKNNKKSLAEKIGLSSGKKDEPAVHKTFLTTMGKGHYIKPVSDLSEANTICRFEVDKTKYITNVFWTAGHGGAIGIGTEKQTSAYPEFGSLDAWKILAEGLDLR